MGMMRGMNVRAGRGVLVGPAVAAALPTLTTRHTANVIQVLLLKHSLGAEEHTFDVRDGQPPPAQLLPYARMLVLQEVRLETIDSTPNSAAPCRFKAVPCRRGPQAMQPSCTVPPRALALLTRVFGPTAAARATAPAVGRSSVPAAVRLQRG